MTEQSPEVDTLLHHEYVHVGMTCGRCGQPRESIVHRSLTPEQKLAKLRVYFEAELADDPTDETAQWALALILGERTDDW